MPVILRGKQRSLLIHRKSRGIRAVLAAKKIYEDNHVLYIIFMVVVKKEYGYSQRKTGLENWWDDVLYATEVLKLLNLYFIILVNCYAYFVSRRGWSTSFILYTVHYTKPL